MSQILKLTHENQQLKRQINQYQQVLGVSPYVNDSLFKGGYRVVKTIVDRDAIKCCWRKQGMKVVVIGEDYSYKEYVLKTSDCNENIWEEINLTVEENEVFLIEDYSELSENLTTQKELNLILKQLILNLQTALDEKQDILTENNVGQFMELELSTKNTPSTGDTVLGRDSLTGKAVEIPTSSLGGNGNVDTSNLVPYTGANKDVNIGANYFKTSKGFDFTYDESNYFKTDHSNSYNNLIFYSEDSSNDNFGYMFIEANPEIGFVVNIANGDGIFNSFHATESRTYSEKPFVSSEGFIKTGGTPNQALTANGGVYDLTTKADLVDGKVPKAQSQPSTMVMDSSTYVITFTDATGAVQTIDLPLESLFQDANYDETTKSLIVTLQDGTTRTIPLTDLVDLPEIVLATTNPAVTPTTGQKVWFNTSLGKVWFNVSGVWTYAGNLMTDAEKVKLSKTSGTNTGDETNSTILSKIGYTPENTLNKSSDVLADKASSIKYPTVKAIYDYLQPEFNSRLKSYSYDSFSEFPINIQPDAFFIDRELGDVYIGWSDPNYFGDPGLGSTYYKNISLQLGETLSTAYRGDRGKIAYDHSQATGNPHNTKVEELTDVGSETPSIADTDIILKKEIGGLWKKISWANIKSTLKTSFTHDISVANWNLVSGKYEAVISNAGILANSFVDVIPSNDNVDIVRSAQIYPSVLISAGSVKVYSKFLPSGTISVTININ